MKQAIEIILRKVQNLSMSIEEAQALLEVVMRQENQTIISNQKIEPYNTGRPYPTYPDVVYTSTTGKQQINS